MKFAPKTSACGRGSPHLFSDLFCHTTGDGRNPALRPAPWMVETLSGWWFGTLGLFSHILGRILPIDELIFFRGVGQPPTS